MDDLRKGTGGLWPRAQIKAGFRTRFGPQVTARRTSLERQKNETEDAHRNRLLANKDEAVNYELVKRAVYGQEISDEHPTGWNFAAAHARADIIRRLLSEATT